MERAIAPARALPADLEKQGAWAGMRGYDVGFDPQPPARTWRYRVDADLQAMDGQTLGYPWVEIVEHINAQPSLTYTAGVWEAGGGTAIPLDALNVESATVWTMPVSAAEIMPRLRPLETDGRTPIPVPPVMAETRRFSLRPNLVEAHGQDLRAFLSPQGTGIAWLATRPAELLAFTPPIRQNPTMTRSGLVQVTNLGISVKDSPQNTVVMVTRLDNGALVAGANVSIRDRQNKVAASGVTDEQGLAVAQVLRQRLQGRPGAVDPRGQGLADRRHDQLGIADGRQRDEVYAVREGGAQVGSRAESEARLAAAAGAGQRDQPRPGQEVLDGDDLALAPDEAGELGGQAGPSGRRDRQTRGAHGR